MEVEPDEETFERPSVNIDLPEILQKGKLTVLAENSSTSYFIYKGKKMGFEYIDHPMGNTGHCSCPIWMTKSLV